MKLVGSLADASPLRGKQILIPCKLYSQNASRASQFEKTEQKTQCVAPYRLVHSQGVAIARDRKRRWVVVHILADRLFFFITFLNLGVVCEPSGVACQVSEIVTCRSPASGTDSEVIV